MYKIEKNIEIPDKRNYGQTAKYPLKEMEIGDSFFIKTESYEEAQKAMRTLHATKYRLGIKIAVRTYKDGVRCWRIA